MMLVRLLLMLLALCLPISAEAQTFPARDRQPVVDAANLLSPEQEAQISTLAEEINRTTTRQFVVATIPDLQGYDISDYGYQLGRKWGLGQKGANNGILLIVAPNDRKVRIEVGYGLEPIMTDALSNQIIQDTILPRFKSGDMAGGIVAGAQAIGEQMKLPLEAAEQRAQQQTKPKTTARRTNSGGDFPWSLVFWGVIFLFVILPMLGLGRRRRRGPWGRRYRGGGGSAWPIILWSIADEMSRSSHRGGGWSGGSGWGGSGGGGWGSGGGGGFSGGGGSFGGGGASGSW